MKHDRLVQPVCRFVEGFGDFFLLTTMARKADDDGITGLCGGENVAPLREEVGYGCRLVDQEPVIWQINACTAHGFGDELGVVDRAFQIRQLACGGGEGLEVAVVVNAHDHAELCRHNGKCPQAAGGGNT